MAAGIRKSLKRIVLGSGDLSHQCAMATSDPQSEVMVWLRGLGAPLDVTYSQFMACGLPFLIGIGLEENTAASVKDSSRLSLRIQHTDGQELADISLRLHSKIAAGPHQVCLFAAKSTRNYCLPRPQLWARYLYYAYQRWRVPDSEFHLSAREVHAMIAFYLCPRTVALVSVCDGKQACNIFPMNLIGGIGGDYFALALKSGKAVTALVGRSGKISLSSIPPDQASCAYKLAKNHTRESAEWDHVPFEISHSTTLALPVPRFAVRVREMKVEETYAVGSHTLFIARTVHEERWSNGPHFAMVHGLYQSRKQRTDKLAPLPGTVAVGPH